MQEDTFDLIRPYNDAEMRAAVPRIISDPAYGPMMDFLFTKEEKEDITQKVQEVETIADFQRVFTLPSVTAVMKKTAGECSFSGVENLTKTHMLIGNHRDIALDSSILGLHLITRGITPPAMNWGSNLEVSQFIVDLGKSNQMITVFRDGSPKEILRNSQRLSAFINQLIAKGERSVWIAQSKGRTKDGLDKMDPSILKMLILSGDKNVKQAILDLNLLAVTISYELEPCGGMKVREVYLSQQTKYVKDKNEDFNSILGGIIMPKGNIHLAIGKPMNHAIEKLSDDIPNNDFIQQVAALIDKETQRNYKLWPTNFLAYDYLEKNTRFKEEYTENARQLLEERCRTAIEITKGDDEKVRQLFYQMYANPVYSKIANGFL
jgi:hypothetical protein